MITDPNAMATDGGYALPAGLQAAMDEQQVDTVPAETDAKPEESAREEADSARIAGFEADQKFPDHTKQIIDEISELRTYVNHDVMVPKTPRAVAENLILRNQYIRMGQTWAKNPDLSVQPRKLLGPKPQFAQLPPPEAVMGDPALQQAVVEDKQQQDDYRSFVEALAAFGQTIEIVSKKFFDDAGGKDVLEGGIQDVQTDGFWWVKVSWQESLGRDPTGNRRAPDFEDTVAKLQALASDFTAGVFAEDDERYSEYLDLSETVRCQLMAESWAQGAPMQQGTDAQTGAPIMGSVDPRDVAWQTGERAPCAAIAEIPRQRTFRMDPVDPRDIRRDWSITRPEEWRKSRHISEAIWMTDAEIKTTFGLDDEGLRDVLSSPSASSSSAIADDLHTESSSALLTTEDPDDRSDPEKTTRNGQHLVWERWDRSANRRYVWIAGTRKFLVNEVPSVVSKFFFPYFLLWFNRVTGRFEPISDAKLQRPLNDEYNLLRSHDRQARRASYNKYIVARNLLSEDEKAKLESCPPEGVIEVKRAKEVSKYLHTIVGGNYQPLLYDTSKVRQALDETANIPSAARGNTAASKFATSDAIANAVMNEQADRYRGKIEAFCFEIFYHMTDILVQVLPEANAKAIAGPGAVWPMMDREMLWSNLQLTIEAGSTGKPDQQRKLALYEQFAGICSTLGVGMPGSAWQFQPLTILKDLLDTMGIRIEPERYIEPAPMPMPPPPMAGGPPARGGKSKSNRSGPPAGSDSPDGDGAAAQERAAGHGIELPPPHQPPGVAA